MKKKCFKLFSVFLLVMLTVIRVNAKVSFVGETVNHEGEYDSTIFVAGNKVNDTSTADGIKFIAGNTIELKGKSTYGFYAGNVITVNANIEKDLFVAGNSISIGSESVLSRDVYLAGSVVKISSNVGRNINVGCESIDITGITINGYANLYCDELLMDETTVIKGKLTYPKDARVKGLESASIESIKVVDTSDLEVKKSISDIIWDFVIKVFAGFIVLIALFRFIPSSKEALDKLELTFDNFAKRGCSGIIVLIVVPLISLFALISGILTPIAIITLLVYGISIYLSFLIISYIIGKVLFTKVFKKDNLYIMMMCGIFVFRLLQLIPVIGSFVTLISLFCGLGFIYKFITQKRK